jgi:predicted RNA-binding protein associated with RNAse of E/G family
MWSYPGSILEQDESGVLVQAYFDRELVNLGLLELRRGDRFLERYYFDRWYNIFAVYSGKSGPPKGWYCNIARPAVLEAARLRADDLALDYIVLPDGRMQLLDEDEFRALMLEEGERLAARRALDSLRNMMYTRQAPFSRIES